MIIFSNLWINCSFMVKTKELDSLTLNLQTFPWGGKGFKSAFVLTTDNGDHMWRQACISSVFTSIATSWFWNTPTFRDGSSSRKKNVSFVATMYSLQFLFLKIEVKEKTNIL